MGCPKPFSLAGGMGAALLENPERAKEVNKLSFIFPHLLEEIQVRLTSKFIRMMFV